MPDKTQGCIETNSIVSARDGMPYVQLIWVGNGAQMTPPEAIKFAMVLIQCAEAAMSDAILCGFLKDRVGLEPQQYAQILQDFRQQREKLSVTKS